MSIIADAMRKSARENRVPVSGAPVGRRRPDVDVSGRWTLLAELEQSNAALREFLGEAQSDVGPHCSDD